jgi:hypothetical protein
MFFSPAWFHMFFEILQKNPSEFYLFSRLLLLGLWNKILGEVEPEVLQLGIRMQTAGTYSLARKYFLSFLFY